MRAVTALVDTTTMTPPIETPPAVPPAPTQAFRHESWRLLQVTLDPLALPRRLPARWVTPPTRP
jgi:hypothetical protein